LHPEGCGSEGFCDEDLLGILVNRNAEGLPSRSFPGGVFADEEHGDSASGVITREANTRSGQILGSEKGFELSSQVGRVEG